MPTQPDIFISHCSADKALAEKLVDILLNNGCNVSSDRILCTSLEGMGIPAGTASFIEFLREQIQEPKLVILLLTENYFASTFCVCEMGAAWGMGLATFPLVVPPLKKSRLKGTLKVTQAGDILDEAYLDELRDLVKVKLNSEASTPRWTVKRDEFLKAAPEIVDSLPSPSVVDRSDLDKATANYGEAVKEITSKEQEIEALNEEIADLRKLKDAKGVRQVVRKFSSTEEQFESLCDAAKEALGRVYGATYEAIYQDARGFEYSPPRDDEDGEPALENEEVRLGDIGLVPNDSHPRVSKALSSIGDVRAFIDSLEDDDPFCEQFEEDKGYPLSFTNREFWNDHL